MVVDAPEEKKLNVAGIKNYAESLKSQRNSLQTQLPEVKHGLCRTNCKNGGAFLGEYDHGKKREGTYTYGNGDWFAGSWQQDEMHGFGTYYWTDTGDWYVGGWKQNRPHGMGFHSSQGKGTWCEGFMVGQENNQDPFPLTEHEMTLRDWQHKFSASPSRGLRTLSQ